MKENNLPELPELPEPEGEYRGCRFHTEAQMRHYALSAIAADRAKHTPVVTDEQEGEWIDIQKRLPERGQRIQGLSRSGAWIETFDPDEPLGHMTHWRAVDDDRAKRELSQPAINRAWLTFTEQKMTKQAFADATRALLANAPQVPEGFVLIPMVPNVEMREVMYEDSWLWEDLLAAAGAITEDQYAELSAAPQPANTEGNDK